MQLVNDPDGLYQHVSTKYTSRIFHIYHPGEAASTLEIMINEIHISFLVNAPWKRLSHFISAERLQPVHYYIRTRAS